MTIGINLQEHDQYLLKTIWDKWTINTLHNTYLVRIQESNPMPLQ